MTEELKLYSIWLRVPGGWEAGDHLIEYSYGKDGKGALKNWSKITGTRLTKDYSSSEIKLKGFKITIQPLEKIASESTLKTSKQR